ncbi:sodium-alanine symporter [Thermus thermophilus]|nr:sodium-alanine symporter [Thermus thermophilus]
MGAPPALVGLFLALLVGVVLGGGIVRVARFAQVVVPLKLLLFLAAVGPLLVLYAGRIPEALALVFQAAFSPEAALGGLRATASSPPSTRGLAGASSPMKRGWVRRPSPTPRPRWTTPCARGSGGSRRCS